MRILMLEEKQLIQDMLLPIFQKNNWQVDFIAHDKFFLPQTQTNLGLYNLIIIDMSYFCYNQNQYMQSFCGRVSVLYLVTDEKEIEVHKNAYMLTKPFSPSILVVLIDEIIKQSAAKLLRENTQQVLADEEGQSFDIITRHVKLNFATREVLIDGALIAHLTPKEYELLKTLIKKPRQVFSREHLLELIWGFEFLGDERTIDAHIKSLRRKISPYGNDFIKTVWGIGYKFDDSVN